METELKVAVNGIRLLGARTGVGRAIEAILAVWARDEPFELVVHSPEPIDEGVLPAGVANVVTAAPRGHAVWEQWSLPRAAAASDVLFCPSYVAPVWAPVPIYLIHHGSYEGHPSAFPWWPRTKARFAYALSARRSTVVSTVSEHSRADMARFYYCRKESIDVIPEGVDTDHYRPLDDAARAAHIRTELTGGEPFFFYVGKPAPRRNLPAIVEALAQLRGHGHPHHLVLAGFDLEAEAASDIVAAAADAGVTSAVHGLGHVDVDMLVDAYNAADALIYPSSYEGFGMPVLEAMACGTTAIALDNTAFPEFAGGVAILLRDAEPGTLAEGMLEAIASRGNRGPAGRERALQFDWRELAPRHADLLRKAARG